jgi:hypothetical protein
VNAKRDEAFQTLKKLVTTSVLAQPDITKSPPRGWAEVLKVVGWSRPSTVRVFSDFPFLFIILEDRLNFKNV